MLTQCPECELQVSDKASFCPHCGFPMNDKVQMPRQRQKKNKRRRLPNGYGQISEIKNKNLRNPFRAMITVGKDEYGKPIAKLLKPKAYFATYNEAYAALMKYNMNPYDISSLCTLKELYEKWMEKYEKSVKSVSGVKTAWKRCEPLHDMQVSDIRTRHLKSCIQDHMPASVKNQLKSMFNMLFDYAVEYELTDKNYARTFKVQVENEEVVHHISYAPEEMEMLWSNVNKDITVEMTLVQCYTGFRPQELFLLETDNVDLYNGYITGGMKTESGMNRVVPIHPKIYGLISSRYTNAKAYGNMYLYYKDCNDPYSYYLYETFRIKFKKMISRLDLNPDHKPHDGRKQFVTLAKKYNVNEYAIKYIVGHKITDITENVYTDRDVSWLKEEIEKIK